MMAITEDTYTFLGTTPDGDPVFMDIAVLQPRARPCVVAPSSSNLRSGSLVEAWRGAGLITTGARELSYDMERRILAVISLCFDHNATDSLDRQGGADHPARNLFDRPIELGVHAAPWASPTGPRTTPAAMAAKCRPAPAQTKPCQTARR